VLYFPFGLRFIWEEKTSHEPRSKDLPCLECEITAISELGSISVFQYAIYSGCTYTPACLVLLKTYIHH